MRSAAGQDTSSSRRRRLTGRPSTRYGRRALLLVGAGIAVQPLTALLVRVGPSAFGVLSALGLAAILAGGAFATSAVLRHGERSLFVLATLPVWLLAILLLVGELASTAAREASRPS